MSLYADAAARVRTGDLPACFPTRARGRSILSCAGHAAAQKRDRGAAGWKVVVRWGNGATEEQVLKNGPAPRSPHTSEHAHTQRTPPSSPPRTAHRNQALRRGAPPSAPRWLAQRRRARCSASPLSPMACLRRPPRSRASELRSSPRPGRRQLRCSAQRRAGSSRHSRTQEQGRAGQGRCNSRRWGTRSRDWARRPGAM